MKKLAKKGEGCHRRKEGDKEGKETKSSIPEPV